MTKIACVVPLYYCSESLYLIIDKFFESIKKYYPQIELITIDDFSPLTLPDRWPVKARNKQNRGYTYAVNHGLKIAFKQADIVIVANDDLEIQKGDLDRFLKIKDIGIYFPSDTASGALDTFGSIWGMNKTTFKIMGLLNTEYKHFCSDKLYYQKAVKKGVPIIHWRDICIKHHESATYNLVNKEQLLKEDLYKFEKRSKGLNSRIKS